MAYSKNDHGFTSSDLSVNCQLTRSASSNEVTLAASKNRDRNFIAFCDELRAYVEEHHHCASNVLPSAKE